MDIPLAAISLSPSCAVPMAQASGILAIVNGGTGSASGFNNGTGTINVSSGVFSTATASSTIYANGGIQTTTVGQALNIISNGNLLLTASSAGSGTVTVAGYTGSGTNAAGGTLYLQGGQSTGNGSGGSIILQTTAKGAAGSSANSYVTGLTINASGGMTTKNNTLDDGNGILTCTTLKAAGTTLITAGGVATFTGQVNFNAGINLNSVCSTSNYGETMNFVSNGSLNMTCSFYGGGILNFYGANAAGANAAGGNVNISGGQSTGTAVGGSVIFQSCPAGTTSNSTLNPLVTSGTLDGSGNWTLGLGSLATNATSGFPYIPTCAGVPTGTPTAKTGFAPLVVDSTDVKLYAYIGGAWKGVALT